MSALWHRAVSVLVCALGCLVHAAPLLVSSRQLVPSPAAGRIAPSLQDEWGQVTCSLSLSLISKGLPFRVPTVTKNCPCADHWAYVFCATIASGSVFFEASRIQQPDFHLPVLGPFATPDVLNLSDASGWPVTLVAAVVKTAEQLCLQSRFAPLEFTHF